MSGIQAQSYRGLAPAKLNLFLHINGQITEGKFQGYHELQTYFQLIEYGDWLQIDVSQTPQITVQWQAGDESILQQPPNVQDDLIYRAAIALQQIAIEQGKPPLGANILLQKNTPIGGGMGGGSSAAATTLLALNRLWALDLSQPQLLELAVRLGADVPVFINQTSAWADGVGERITPMTRPPNTEWFVVVVPQSALLTRHGFAHPQLCRDTPKQDVPYTLSHWQTQAGNAFEPIARQESAAINDCFHALRAQAGFARLTGSGACLFAPVESEAAGQRIAANILNEIKAAKRVIVAKAFVTPACATA
ncbi:MAG: 4-(cytidine 5'-diphospho)-2-C-methyl-D-erythritol kinase [Halothiobacillus sp. 20-53-49]|nr:4-(cytidine 5'-diphospho)-2-C-methyl-D-erythritol kinase [Halothiobacillaceae bacterium]OYV47276.1 MAG: 4-(cytidine 5'-diphospho)-2-C-methyl-D-erythritol kinase [Halothiobacillus sp. 20-53-49]HUM98870.1 4-(cytidine 5'-diphospho)-2-C-methyl-D-erythritol kinase [Halothiobacillus sp.]